jgi:branched-chain amino acid aminotransferase
VAFFHFCEMNVCFNGNFLPGNVPLFFADNRGFKYGDGLFETMKVFKGNLLLSSFHFERLFSSLQLLGIDLSVDFTREILFRNIIDLCYQNNCDTSARIRLAVYRTDENKAGYLIEAIPLSEAVNRWSESGLSIALFPYARKSLDAFSNLKSANFLPYVLAGKYANENGIDDAIVLNSDNYLCDSSKANIYLIKAGKVFTPALHQGCVNGVMRRVVNEAVKGMGYSLRQVEVSEEDLIAADEVFLTNAIQIIRWVKSYHQVQYGYTHTYKIFGAVQATIFSSPC